MAYENGKSGSDALKEGVSRKISPGSSEEVQRLLGEAAASASSVSVYSRNTQSDIGISFSRMNRTLEIDSANLVAVVEPGLKLGDLASALKNEGLRFMPSETPFYHGKSIGEFYYEGCSNISSLKYGSAKHFLMGTEIVLADGQLMKTGGKTVKNVTGYDMTRFMNSPFANLGVTVKYLLKLLPAVPAKKQITAAFDSSAKVSGFIGSLRQAGIVPSYLVWADPRALLLAESKGSSSDHLVLLELDGIKEEVSRQYGSVSSLIAECGSELSGAMRGSISKDRRWKELFTPLRGYSLTDEIKIKRTDEFGFIDKFHSLAEARGVRAGLFGQIGEGKINIYFEELSPAAREFINYLISIVTAEGGYSSGRYNRLLGQCPDGPLTRTELKLKKLFDPKDILKG
jgi:glycolate oxidase